ncbi:hypothetical protein RCL_jg19255.t1 [Rhizophagus clarus]|uniref:Uncharacterized protein n=1 Tax=Rhizophagus clarus TaxID=94130 RepID=A0A8H3QX05_9GLOM|nr:hypothetical protein RCL_jg19255.t1 [Rhizophagus clarus]
MSYLSEGKTHHVIQTYSKRRLCNLKSVFSTNLVITGGENIGESASNRQAGTNLRRSNRQRDVALGRAQLKIGMQLEKRLERHPSHYYKAISDLRIQVPDHRKGRVEMIIKSVWRNWIDRSWYISIFNNFTF